MYFEPVNIRHKKTDRLLAEYYLFVPFESGEFLSRVFHRHIVIGTVFIIQGNFLFSILRLLSFERAILFIDQIFVKEK